MPTGLLEVTGTIDLAQFWPTGQSDADTVKVEVSGSNAFKFRKSPGAPTKITHAFEGAQVHGKVTKDAIDKQGRIVIRLQAVDAPELHYRPTAPTLNKKKPSPTQRAAFNKAIGNFRQNFGETATVQLAKNARQFCKERLEELASLAAGLLKEQLPDSVKNGCRHVQVVANKFRCRPSRIRTSWRGSVVIRYQRRWPLVYALSFN